MPIPPRNQIVGKGIGLANIQTLLYVANKAASRVKYRNMELSFVFLSKPHSDQMPQGSEVSGQPLCPNSKVPVSHPPSE